MIECLLFAMHCEALLPHFMGEETEAPTGAEAGPVPRSWQCALLPSSSEGEGQGPLGAEGRSVILQSDQQGAAEIWASSEAPGNWVFVALRASTSLHFAP